MQTDNPYASPQTLDVENLPAAPLSSGWYVHGKVLCVSEVCILPMVDLYNGKSEERMTMHWITVPFRPSWLWAFPVGTGVLGLLLVSTTDAVSVFAAAALGFILGMILRAVVGHFFPKCTMRAFSQTATWRRRNMISTVMSWLGVFIVVAGLLPFAPLKTIASVLVWVWILRILYVVLFLRRLVCRRRNDGYFEIRGVHPKALAYLREQQSKRDALG